MREQGPDASIEHAHTSPPRASMAGASTSWRQAWDAAQPSLSTIRDSPPTENKLTSRVMRVGKLDSELLDQELLQLLQDPLTKALSTVSVRAASFFTPHTAHYSRAELIQDAVRARTFPDNPSHSVQTLHLELGCQLRCKTPGSPISRPPANLVTYVYVFPPTIIKPHVRSHFWKQYSRKHHPGYRETCSSRMGH